MKSRFSLWIAIIDGEKLWGVNEKLSYGVYTRGPHGGYYSRKDAEEALKRCRAEEREDWKAKRV